MSMQIFHCFRNTSKLNIETEESLENKIVNITLEEAIKRNKEIIQVC